LSSFKRRDERLREGNEEEMGGNNPMSITLNGEQDAAQQVFEQRELE